VVKVKAMGPMKVTTKYASIEGIAPAAALTRSVALHAVDVAEGVEHVGAMREAQAIVHPQGWHALPADNDAHPDGLLSRTEFLRMVQREKRRTDRSHSALSLAALVVDPNGGSTLQHVLEKVLSMVRETDYVTATDDQCIAVLLPDTGEAGLRSFLDKLALSRDAQGAHAAGATYPDTSFDRLIGEHLGTPRSRHAADADEPSPLRSQGYRGKRALDVLGALVALVLLSPLMLIVALLIRLTSPGPAIFRQTRVGQGGALFTMLKFRSMRTDIDDSVHRQFVASLIDGKVKPSAAGTAGQFKMKGDPRITAIGRFIRKTSIDELPQFYNVLKGDMSLVGPRPPVQYEADKYKAWHRRRVFEMRPGLTGIWQVEGRSRVSFDDMVRMDLRYLQHCSLGFDLSILLRTVSVVLTCEGAQ
jgi:lipopolysaccharide/colanic/teichoic acid biosynthesis glycosyltransferase/ribosomal protein L32